MDRKAFAAAPALLQLGLVSEQQRMTGIPGAAAAAAGSVAPAAVAAGGAAVGAATAAAAAQAHSNLASADGRGFDQAVHLAVPAALSVAADIVR